MLVVQVHYKHPQVLQAAGEWNTQFNSCEKHEPIGERFVLSNKIALTYTNNIQNFSFQAHLTATLPYPFSEELQGIANSSGIPLGNNYKHFINVVEN